MARLRYRTIIMLLSIIAEELVFRLVVDVYMGIWISAALFAAIHLPKTLRTAVILAAVSLMCSVGNMYSFWLALALHAAYDVMVLYKKNKPRQKQGFIYKKPNRI